MKLGNYKANDVELCRTLNKKVVEETTLTLMENHIPFTRTEQNIPFFLRLKYQGAKQFWIISINPRRYGQARRVIDKLDNIYRKRLILSNL